MTRTNAAVIATTFVVCLVAGLLSSSATSVRDVAGADATIAALQTEVAEFTAQVAERTPAATATPAPGTAVPSEPHLLAEGLELLYSYMVADGARSIVMGELRNTTDQRWDSPYLQLTAVDREGAIVGTTEVRAALVTIDAGETVPFERIVYEIDRAAWHSETFTVCEWTLTRYVDQGYGASPDLHLQEIQEIEQSSDQLHIEGEVLNSGNTPIENVTVHGFVYLPDGRFAGVVRTRIESPIPPDQTARFSLSGTAADLPGLGLPEAGDGYTYQLWVGTEPRTTLHWC